MKKRTQFFAIVLCFVFVNLFANTENETLLKKKPTTTQASTFGIKADLEYLDVILGSNNKITKVTGSFASTDVGKFLAIKKGHYNAPDSSTGDVIPFTQEGRLVTATVYIASVSNGEATVQVVSDGNLVDTGIVLNQNSTIAKRAYMYTNNFDAIRSAMESCYTTGSNILDFDLDGIVGINPFYGTNFVNNKKALVFKSSVGDLEISTSNNARLKICTEFNGHVPHNLFIADQGSGDITVDISCVPPDTGSTMWGARSPEIFYGNDFSGSSGSSVRNIKLKNLTFPMSDVDNNDAFWVSIYNSSRGGVNSTQVQSVTIENTNIQTKHGGVSIFSQNGATNEEYLNNVTFNYTSHYNGESGRSFINGDKNSESGQWRFDATNFTKTGDTLEVNNSSMDFSFYDYPNLNRTMYFFFEGATYKLDLSWSGMTAHKAKLIPTSVWFESQYSNLMSFLVIKYEADAYGHPHYVHPNVSFILDSVTSANGNFRYYSSGGQQGTPTFTIIRNSTINSFEFNNSGASNGANLKLENSDVDFYLAELEKLTLTNSITTGLRVKANELEVIGSNNTISHGGSVQGMESFSMIGNKMSIPSYGLTFSNKDSLGVDTPVSISLQQTDFLGGFMPKVNNGVLTISDAVPKEDVLLRILPNSFTSNTTLNITNVYLHGISGAGTWFNGGFQDANVNFSEFVFNNYVGYVGLKFPDFDNQSKYNGIFSVTTNPKEPIRNAYYAADVYNHLPYFLQRQDINVMGCDVLLSNKFTMSDNKAVSMIIATFRAETPAYESYFSKIDWGNNAYVNGDHTFDVVIGDNSKINPYHVKTVTIQQQRRNTTLSNLVVSSSFREKDEVVTFKSDPKQARIIEVLPTTPVKHYTDADEISELPYFGIDKEIVYSNTGLGGMYFKHKIEFDSISNTTYTIPQDSISVDSNNNTKIKTGIYFSIGQEFYEPNKEWLNFEFNLKTTNSGKLNFKVARNLRGIHSDYLNSWWVFESWNDNNTPNNLNDDILIAECYIENQTGEIIFNGTVNVEDSTNNFEIVNGLKINSHNWELYYEDCSYSDRLALMELYNATNGPNWTNNTNWGSSQPLYNWYGVEVNSNGCVHKLNLNNNGLNGSLPEGIGNFSDIVVLNLSYNQLINSIPTTIGDLSSLKYLLLDHNALSGNLPTTIGNLSSLVSFGGNHNQLTGNIPTSIGDLLNLEFVSLSDNQLNNSIPSSIGNLSKLKQLHLQNNQLNNAIPSSLGSLSNLNILYLNGNQLTGSLPSSLGNLNSLTHMKLHYNQLTGSIPSNFSNLNNATSLDFRYNNLSGCFPNELTSLCGVNDVNFYGNSQLPNNGDFASFCSSGAGSCTPPPNRLNHENKLDFAIYPNPNSGNFYIKVKEVTKELYVEVYNLLGEKVYSKKDFNTENMSINLKNQAKGIYTLKIIIDTGTITKKVIIE
jgi:Leucine-rich repeat (LRR) protein